MNSDNSNTLAFLSQIQPNNLLIQKKLFEEGSFVNPKFTYSIDIDTLTASLTSTNQELSQQQPSDNKIVQNFYYKIVQSKKSKLELLMAIYNQDWNVYSLANEQLYGEISPLYFSWATFIVQRRLLKFLNKKSISSISYQWRLKYALDFYKLLKDIPSVKSPILPNERERKKIEQSLPLSFLNSLDLNKKNTLYSPSEISTVFYKCFENLGLKNWKAVIDDSSIRTAVLVNNLENKVIIPSSRFISASKLKKLLVHEIYTHVVRNEQGSKSSFSFLKIGLDHSIVGEEGIAVVREQTLQKKITSYVGSSTYFALGIALGLDNGKKKDFREVFEIMLKYYLFLKSRKYEDEIDLLNRSKTAAWKVCCRIFRGTDGQQKGVVFLKDKLYMEGNIRIWEVVKNQPELIPYFNIGKYDPANKEHVSGLQKLGLIPQF